MIPKRLKLKGLYSYQTEQEIDFDPLTDASLFGIFGSVGVGNLPFWKRSHLRCMVIPSGLISRATTGPIT
jgi:hypothetical protein